MIKTILLATDLGVSTPFLLQHACHLSAQYGAKLLVVHAIEPMGALGHVMLKAFMPPEEVALNSIDLVERQVKAQVVDALTDEYMNGEEGLSLLGEVIVRAGEPLAVISEAIVDANADLLVVGNHSGNDNSVLMGSVASKILQTSKIPVYFVPIAAIPWQQVAPG